MNQSELWKFSDFLADGVRTSDLLDRDGWFVRGKSTQALYISHPELERDGFGGVYLNWIENGKTHLVVLERATVAPRQIQILYKADVPLTDLTKEFQNRVLKQLVSVLRRIIVEKKEGLEPSAMDDLNTVREASYGAPPDKLDGLISETGAKWHSDRIRRAYPGLAIGVLMVPTWNRYVLVVDYKKTRRASAESNYTFRILGREVGHFISKCLDLSLEIVETPGSGKGVKEYNVSGPETGIDSLMDFGYSPV